MSEQLDLFGLPPCHDRLFWGLAPANPDGTRISQLADGWRDELGLSGRLLAPAQLHVSLYALGDYSGIPQGLIDAARQAGDAVRLPPFDVLRSRDEFLSQGSQKSIRSQTKYKDHSAIGVSSRAWRVHEKCGPDAMGDTAFHTAHDAALRSADGC